MAISPEILKPFISALSALQATGYLAGESRMTILTTARLILHTGASLILVLYDWLLTLKDEVELIVPTPWTVVKVLYCIVRLPYERLIKGLPGVAIRYE